MTARLMTARLMTARLMTARLITARRPPRLVMAAMVAVVSLSGCEKVTRSVATSVSPCFRVLPQAHQAVGGQGTFVDVARIRGDGVARFPRVLMPSTSLVTPSSSEPPVAGTTRDVCVVAYKGTFDVSRILHLMGPNRQGRYALVVVGVRSQLVRAVLLSDDLPKPLHTH
jgi:hypothetical protein